MLVGAVAAIAAVGTYSWNGCTWKVDVHEHYGAPRTVTTDENGGCHRIRAEHIFDNNGPVQRKSAFVTKNAISIRNAGDQCKGRGWADNDDGNSYAISPWLIWDSSNC